jgi:transposase
MPDVKVLPDNTDELKRIILNLENTYKKKFEEQEKELKEERNKNLVLEEKYKILQRKFFGSKSERIEETPGQIHLFNEAELYCNLHDVEKLDKEEETVTVKSFKRRKKRKSVFSKDLPIVERIHDLSEEEKKCPCCNQERPFIGYDTAKELDIIPEQIRIIEHKQRKYGPCKCEGFKNEEEKQIITANKPKRLLPGTIASEGLLSYVFTAKFLDSMPFNRQEKRFSRFGIGISRTNMCNWVIGVSRKCQDLLELMWKKVREGPFIQMDETGMQVLKEPGRKAKKKGYMFLTIGYTESHKPIVIYHYHRTRNKKIVSEILKGFKGYLQTDGLNIYDDCEDSLNIVEVGCGAHIRRKFFEVAELSGEEGTADKVLKYFKEIYKAERELRHELKDGNITKDVFVRIRKKRTKPFLEELHSLLVSEKDNVPPGVGLGQAINYALKEWDKWIRYLDHWFLTPDNNYAERKIRSYVIGRKNWYFSDTLRGAYSSCTMFSLIHSAHENGLNPYWYLRYLFTKLPYAETEEELYRILPTEVKPEDIKMFKGQLC